MQTTLGLRASKLVKLVPHSVARDWQVSPARAAVEKLQITVVMVLPIFGCGVRELGGIILSEEALEVETFGV